MVRTEQELVGVDVEVVVPEVDQQLEKLAFAVDRTNPSRQPGLPKRQHVNFPDLGLNVVAPQVEDPLTEGRKAAGREPRVGETVVDGRGSKLLVDPSGQACRVGAERFETRNVARAGPKAKAGGRDNRCRRHRNRALVGTLGRALGMAHQAVAAGTLGEGQKAPDQFAAGGRSGFEAGAVSRLHATSKGRCEL
jgi:hypothetical protein